ncbi:HPr family phosphocarrier protein [Vulgatibacter sp.]|uniref:HPr family phosphocarrier protein n=1 Tax=Vulgatibacter sp. TaxID=1971226 RepID=UPI00356697F3
MKTAERTFTIVNKLGLHARAAAKLVQTAAKFRADIHVEREGQQVNGKSIMGVLMLAAAQGTQITVSTEGEDADEALAAIGALVEDGFGEDRG